MAGTPPGLAAAPPAATSVPTATAAIAIVSARMVGRIEYLLRIGELA
jgi:hypothetical protein